MHDDVFPCGKPDKKRWGWLRAAADVILVLAVVSAVLYAGFVIATRTGPIDVPGKRIRVVYE